MKFEKRTETLRVEHQLLINTMEVYTTSIDGFKQRYAIIDGKRWKVYPGTCDDWTTNTLYAKR
jgi:hypothetical protein